MTTIPNEKKDLRKRIKQANSGEKEKLIVKYCTNKVVLDVGAIGQDYNYNTNTWLHSKISNAAEIVHGVDIDKKEINKMNKSGYQFYLYTELEKLNNVYDVIVLADVIEHVGDPETFLRNYSRYLNDKGKIILTTPNCNRARNFISILLFNKYGLNPEHTMWFCPKTLTRLILNSGLTVKEIVWLKEYNKYSNLSFLKLLLVGFESIVAKLRKNFSPNFMIIAGK